MRDDAIVSGAGLRGSLAESAGMGSLAQSARRKHLRSAQGIFTFVGLLTIALNVFGYFQSVTVANLEVGNQIEVLRRRGMPAEAAKLEEARNAQIKAAQLRSVGMILIGVLYLVLAAGVQRFPVPVTIGGLAIYVASAVVIVMLDPAGRATGVVVKVLVAISLVKAVQSAIAYERQSREDEASWAY